MNNSPLSPLPPQREFLLACVAMCLLMVGAVGLVISQRVRPKPALYEKCNEMTSLEIAAK